ncbi:MAG TPA: glycosyltransferase [Candidatus Omnitrophota bacterium]|nr:glycosyltransferase [Candidatus Omnitrophota bacterium]HPS36298.1 glycosyltransferase [Candidatus Omnitrophota bacterium]
MRIAIFHNFIDNIGGAEIVSLTLARELNADIYTTNTDPEKIRSMGFADVLPRIFSIGKIPLNPPWRQQIALGKFRRLDLKKKYDFFVIAGDWAMSGAVKNRSNLWYVHSPIREIWDLYSYVRKTMVPFWGRLFFDLWVIVNRYLNRKYVKAVERVVCNSENTKKRVAKFLGKEAVVIHPPVETSKFRYAPPEGYWLSVNRLIRHKRIDLQMNAFAGLPGERLIIVGSYEQSNHFLDYAAYCTRIKPENVEIKSWVSHEELVELYAHCKGFITTAQDEDFGMNVVEAMASGKPVIAPEEGGYRETVVHAKTGVLIRDIDEDKLRGTIQMLGKELDADPAKYREACRVRAREFDTAVFIEKIKEQISLSPAPGCERNPVHAS